MLTIDFEDCLSKLENDFRQKSENYFFTEKELHSYFYSLCLQNKNFHCDGMNLVHTEYPTPFKSSFLKEYPYLKIADTHSKAMRSHIDLVLINPDFIRWTKGKKYRFDLIKGITNKLYPTYITEFINAYNEFVNETSEQILTYAVEFKYLRNQYEGSKYPIAAIKQDIEKLKNLKSFRLDFMSTNLSFVKKTMSYVFIEDNRKSMYDEILSDFYFNNNLSLFKIVKR